jgi:hypothetical protein
MLSPAPPDTLYQNDYALWLEKTIHTLQRRDFAELDLERLIEELEDLGREQKNAVVSFLDQIIRHLLLLDYWQAEVARNKVHWQGEVYNFRVQLADRLTQTLYNYLALALDDIYRRSLKAVQIKTDRQVSFPQLCPYTLDQLLDIDWLPEGAAPPPNSLL